jgi:ribosomal protein S18 acetylase RimI-like enzyme
MHMAPEQLADLNLVDSMRIYARWRTPSEIEERDGLLLVAGPTRLPASFMNGALRTDSQLSPEQALNRAREFFAQRSRSFTFVTRTHCDADLEEHLAVQGFVRDSDAPCMLVEQALPEKPIPNGARVERLRSVAQVPDIVQIGADAYQALGLPEQQAAAAFNRPEGLFDGAVSGAIAYLGEQPASMALTIHSGESAGVYWVGTKRFARGRGLAELCTRIATNDGFARGARVVTLQASEFGEPIYRRMGYREYDRQGRFRPPPK